MAPLNNKEYILKTIKEILNFVFNVSMLIWALWIIVRGGHALGIGILSLIPFVYLFYFFTKDIPTKDEKIDLLQNNLDYYKKRLSQYEDTEN